jgi:ribosomal protein L21E
MSIIQKIFSALNADEKQAVKTELAQAELKEGTTIEADSFEEGQAVFIVTEDGEKIPMPEGTYELEDGRNIEVNDSSMIVAIGSGEEKEEEAEGEAEVEQEAKEEMSEEGEAPKEEELKEDEKEEMGDMDKLREELRQYVREVVMEAMKEKEGKAEMSSEEGEAKVEEAAPEAVAEETEEKAEKAEEVAVEASAQKVTAKIKVKPEGTRPDTIDWFKPQMRSTTMGNVFKHINK